MENRGYFFVLVVVLLVLSVGSAQMSSDNYNSTVIVTNGGDNNTIVGIISGDMSSDNYSNQLGFFYDSNVGPDDPVVSIITASGNNISSDDVLCSANVYDSNGGSLTVETRWYLNDSLNLTINYSSISNGEFNATLDSDYTTKYDNWSCSMRLYDGSLYSSWGNSSNLTILNNAPTVTLVSPVNGNVTSDRSPTFTWTGSDIDGDDLTYDINISLYDSVQDTRHETGLTNLTYTPSDLLFLWDNGYYYIWKVRANDGEVYGSWSAEWNISIESLVSINLTISDVYFGALSIGESQNTDDADLNPFIVENDGNSLINVSINSSALWDTQTEDSEFYQFKVGNISGEENSFNWTGSVVDWFDMPLSDFAVAINKLNYEDASDSAEVDINITVPANEDSGVKNSTVVFSAVLAE